MKKLYYALPFILVPSVLLLCEFLGNTELIKMNPYITGLFLLLISAIMGNITYANKRFDYLISALMPVSLFVFMFVLGLLEQTETRARFDFSKAIQVATQPLVLLLCFGMAVTAFLLSFKPLRILKRNAD